MTDRELLELAAKAAGYELDYTIRPDGKAFYHSDRGAMALADGGWFAPLTDDGDALRLAADLGISIVHRRSVATGDQLAVAAGLYVSDYDETETYYNGDRRAATRRAIVRAAAAIGAAK